MNTNSNVNEDEDDLPVLPNYKFAERQFEIYKMRAMKAHAEIVSGSYKSLKRYKMVEVRPGEVPALKEVLCSDEDNLNLITNRMDRFIHLMDECSEFMDKLERDSIQK